MMSADAAESWWLRSSYSGSAACITVDGSLSGTDVEYAHINALRPAFNLDIAYVILTSDASGASAKSSATVGSGMIPAEPVGDILKLTVLNTTFATGFDASANKSVVRPGGTVSIDYTVAVLTAANQFVSCLLKNDSGDVLYYGKLADNSASAAASVNVTISGNLPAGDYTLEVFNEEANGDLYTDFASYPVVIAIIVTAVPSNPSNPSSPSTPSSPQPTIDGGRGWDKITDKVKDLQDSDKLDIDMNGTTDVPGSFLSRCRVCLAACAARKSLPPHKRASVKDWRGGNGNRNDRSFDSEDIYKIDE